MSLSAPITARTAPERYQITRSEVKARRPALDVVKILWTAASVACAVVCSRCGLVLGKSVSRQTFCWPSPPSSARPKRVSGTSDFSTWKAIALA